MFYAYILESLKDKRRYIGYTENLKKRIDEHNKGTNISTKNRTPLRLIYYEACLNKVDAKNREKYLKGRWGTKFINTRLKNYYKNYKFRVNCP